MGNIYDFDGGRLNVFSGVNMKIRHIHEAIELLYVLDGEVKVTVENTSYHMKQKDVMIVNSWKEHAIHSIDEQESLLCCIHIKHKLFSEYTGQHNVFLWCNSMQDSEQKSFHDLRSVLNKILLDYTIGNKKKYFFRYSQYYLFLHLLATHYLVSNEDISMGGSSIGQEDKRYEEILEYIEENYSRDIKLSEIADEFHLSLSYLSKYLKKKMGTNFTDYLYSVRMRYAVDEMLNTDNLVTRIALDHGFPNIGVFNRRFKDIYKCTPSVYRKKMRKEAIGYDTSIEPSEGKNIARERLKTYFDINPAEDDEVVTQDNLLLKINTQNGERYTPVWNRGINIGDITFLKYSDVRDALLHMHKRLKVKYVRIWNIFGDDLHVVKNGEQNNNGFSKINQVINLLVDNHMKPILELSAKPKRIYLSPDEYLNDQKSRAFFQNYDEFKYYLEELIRNFLSYFGKDEAQSWLFELEENFPEEMFNESIDYFQCYQDCRDIIKKYLPGTHLGGAGSRLGWSTEYMENSIKRWINSGIYPDYLTVKYYPYAAGDQYQEKFSKRKTDEDDLKNSLNQLHYLMKKYDFPDRPVFISDWNMSVSSRNYFNDSLWKGCYILKCNLESVGQVESLTYGQMTDSTTDYSDTQLLINGSGGLLTGDMIEKPAFFAMKFLAGLYPIMVERGEGYAVTRNDVNEFAIVLYNFIDRNYRYYMDGESDNTVKDHYQYFEHLDNKKIELVLKNLPDNTVYRMRQHILNREHGSIMDEWKKLSCIENPQKSDIDYLRKICTPEIQFRYETVKKHTIKLNCSLKPLEMRFITLKRL